MPKYKTVRLKEEEWELLREARKELRRRGYQSFEEWYHDEEEEEGDEEEDDEEGEYEEGDEEEFDVGGLLSSIALGAIVGLGAIALLKILSGDDDEGR